MSRDLSKLLSFVLRHEPGHLGLHLLPGGWVPVDALIAAAQARGHGLDRQRLEAIVADSDKQRFTLSSDGLLIRAAQGHSVPVDLGLVPVAPPELLYHGTAEASLSAIRAQGLVAGKRRQVHLSGDPETARRVGMRHGRPVVLMVAAGDMYRSGHSFHQADNGVWLTDAVPPGFLSEG